MVNTKNLCKKTKICKNNLGINRKYMPQIEDDQIKPFIKFIRKTNKINKKKIPTNILKSTQNQLYIPAIRKKQTKLSYGKKLNMKPIFISNNNYILDGHHRWATLRDCEMFPINCNYKIKNPKIDVYQINMPIKKLIKKTKKFNNIKYQDIY